MDAHPNQISQWKRQLLDAGATIFDHAPARQQQQQQAREAELFEQIGRLKMELEWLKKKLPPSVEIKRMMIEPINADISIRRQCELLGLNHATLYYTPATETAVQLRVDAVD